ncbi:MAG: PfkB family carbohydrate kinase, partial [Pseudohongiellaceae bacterium]
MDAEYTTGGGPGHSSGGSAANTIIAIGQLGGKAAYKTILGDDAFGAFYAQEFRDLGIILDA